jgi:hypothetical protein
MEDDSDVCLWSAPQQSSPPPPVPHPQPDNCEWSALQQALEAPEPQQAFDCATGAPQQSDLPVGSPTIFLIILTNSFSFCVDMG